MENEKLVKDIMIPIEEFETIEVDDYLCSVLIKFKSHYEKFKHQADSRFSKTIFVVDKPGNIIGKLSVYRFIRGLVPETSKKPEFRAIYSALTSRARQVSNDVFEFQEQFKWVHASFFNLVKQEALKSIRECMVPVHAVLKEEDGINWAIYMMSKNNVRELLVTRDNKVIGVVNFTRIFDELMNIIGPECEVLLGPTGLNHQR